MRGLKLSFVPHNDHSSRIMAAILVAVFTQVHHSRGRINLLFRLFTLKHCLICLWWPVPLVSIQPALVMWPGPCSNTSKCVLASALAIISDLYMIRKHEAGLLFSCIVYHGQPCLLSEYITVEQKKEVGNQSHTLSFEHGQSDLTELLFPSCSWQTGWWHRQLAEEAHWTSCHHPGGGRSGRVHDRRKRGSSHRLLQGEPMTSDLLLRPSCARSLMLQSLSVVILCRKV